jgi:hypothetical protein
VIERLARSRPALSIALVGPYASGSFGMGLPPERLARLRQLPNVYLLGSTWRWGSRW